MWGGPEAPLYKETASQSWGIGDLIYLDSNGTLAICAVTSDVMTSAIAGQATKAAIGGSTVNPVHFRPIIPGDLYEINLFHLTVALAVGTLAMQGTVRGLFWKDGALGVTTNTGSTKKWVIDLNTAVEGAADSNARVRIIHFPERPRGGAAANAFGDIYAVALCMFLGYSFASDSVPAQRLLQFAL
jgi:hypothetical protein